MEKKLCAYGCILFCCSSYHLPLCTQVLDAKVTQIFLLI